MKKIYFIVGIGLGYVLGTRQGRAGYDRLKKRATKLWKDPRVQRGVRDAQNLVRDRVPAASETVDKIVESAEANAATSTPAEGLPSNL